MIAPSSSRLLGPLLTLLGGIGLVLGLPGCERGVPPRPAPSPAVVEERFATRPAPLDDLDSLAFWPGEGHDWLLATAKATDVVRVFDGGSGELLHTIGSSTGADRFERPNGVAVIDDLMLVVERDNRRVQVLRLPAGEVVGVFGREWLRWPYGLAIFRGDDGYELYVTDNGPAPDDAGVGGPPVERVKHFHLRLEGDRVEADLVHAFGSGAGDPSSDGTSRSLEKVESILADPDHDRLLVAEEAEGRLVIKLYSLGGEYRGDLLSGQLRVEPEGIGLYACGGEEGYYLFTDQQPARTVFLVVDRRSLGSRGSFVGGSTANTDGVVVTQHPQSDLPAGAFYAINDDSRVSAFDWRDIASALDLRRDCVEPP